MNFAEFAASRKSVRGFTKEPVSRETIEKIMDAAKWAPSSYNTQTWKVHVVSGDVLDKIREGNTKNTMAGKPHVRDFPYKEDYEGTHRRRQIDVAIQLFEAMGIERDDKENVPTGCYAAFVSSMRQSLWCLRMTKIWSQPV